MSSIIACHDCDLIQRLPHVSETGTVQCIRCGAVLHSKKRNSIERTLAWTVANDRPHDLLLPFQLSRFENGGLIDEGAASGVAH